jgi:hypothetical protein
MALGQRRRTVAGAARAEAGRGLQHHEKFIDSQRNTLA